MWGDLSQYKRYIPIALFCGFAFGIIVGTQTFNSWTVAIALAVGIPILQYVIYRFVLFR